MPLNLRDVQAYGALSKNPALNLRDVEAYAAIVGSKQIHVRNVVGYALARVPIVPNFGQAATVSMLASLNVQYKTSFTASQVMFNNLQALTNDDAGYNSSIDLWATRTSGYGGKRTLRYNRWPIATAFSGKDATQLPSSLGNSIYNSLSAINTKFGLVLTTDDVVDATIASGATGFTLTAKSTSMYFNPGTTMRIGAAA